MSALSITLNINLTLADGELQVTSADVVGPTGGVAVVATATEATDPMSPSLKALLARAPRVHVIRYTRFLERCVEQVEAQLAPPESGDRAYVNINPPAGVRGARLAALTLSSGRLAFHGMAPERAGDWSHAEVVNINGEPTYVRIYLHDDEHVEQAMEMLAHELENRQ